MYTTHIPLAQIVPGKNPRRHFDEASLKQLVRSIEAVGIIQPITVRKRENSDMFEIIAGERRFRAATMTKCNTIPALVCEDIPDDLAEAMALTENTEREQMTAVEEAEAAHGVINRHNGSQTSAAAFLGWSLSKLRRRVALMNCSSAVRDALQQNKISVAMAEYLATQSSDKQDAALPTIIESKLSVEVVRDNIIGKARNLAEAIFDKAACQGCQHNSEVQAELFSNNIGSHLCTNGTCFDNKLEAKLSALAEVYTDTYRKIVIMRVDNSPPALTLAAEGDKGVGTEQAVACKACPEYGVAVSGLPNSLGMVREGVCFNPTCNAEKVKLAHPAPQPTPQQEMKPHPAAPGVVTKREPTGQSKGGTGKASETAAKKPSSTKPQVLELTAAMKDYRRKVWDKALMKAALSASPERALSLLVVQILRNEHRHPVQAYAKAVALKFAKDTDAQDVPEAADEGLAKWVVQNPANAPKLLAGLLACHAPSMEERNVKLLLCLADQAIETHWKPDDALWALLTKSEIDSIGTEIGLAAHLGNRWKKLIGGKKDELLTGITQSGFDFNNKIPAFMRWDPSKDNLS